MTAHNNLAHEAFTRIVHTMLADHLIEENTKQYVTIEVALDKLVAILKHSTDYLENVDWLEGNMRDPRGITSDGSLGKMIRRCALPMDAYYHYRFHKQQEITIPEMRRLLITSTLSAMRASVKLYR